MPDALTFLISSGSGMRPRWPRVTCWTRRRTCRPSCWPAGWRGSGPRPPWRDRGGRPRRTHSRARVQRDRGDVGQPATTPNTKPAVHRDPGSVVHDIQQRPWSATAPHHRRPANPGSRATAATAWASSPTRRQASVRARSGQHRPRPIATVCSVQVWAAQAGPTQRQIRLRQASTFGRLSCRGCGLHVRHSYATAALAAGSRPRW